MSAIQIDVVIPTYNAADRLAETLELLIPHARSISANVILVDDGSSDGTVAVAELYAHDVHLVCLKQNGGRAAACNAGVAAGTGKAIVFLDADCSYAYEDGLAAHARGLEQRAQVTVGPLAQAGESFWAKYQREVATRRSKAFETNDRAAMTSASMGIRRDLFESVGGFDPGFRHYGFEDRDLFLRLIERGVYITLLPRAAVVHRAELRLTDICRKMRVAGSTTGPLFRSRHPDAYARMDFSRADVSCGGWHRRSLASLSRPLLPSIVAAADALTEVRPLPYRMRRTVARMLIGVSYLVGTADARSS